jgi:MYXO-CTERM domain-containing protein
MGRKADIGAVDLAGHDQDKVGKFGTAPSESTPPTVALTAPAAGASITGMTTLSATAMDSGSGVVLVQFQVDGSTVAQVAKSPYSISWNSAVVSNAAHMFTAKAWDAAGNFAVSAAVMATVTGNTPTTKPTPGTAGSSGSSSGTAGASGTAGVTGNATGTAGSGVATGSGCGCAHTGGASFAGLGLALSLMVLTRGRRRRD